MPKKILYFDAYSGIAGDMTLGALLHLGLPLDYLKAGLDQLKLHGYQLEVKPTEQQHITGLKFEVILDESHDHEYRGVKIIHDLIDDTDLASRIKNRAKQIFWLLAQAEGLIHGISPYEVHFHEVGAVDAIVDIVGSCIGFEYFEIDEFYCSPLPVGSGFVQAAHGLMPVPAPATLQLLAQAGAKLQPSLILSNGAEYPARSEMVTPTGAAIVAALCQKAARPSMTLEHIGYGFGSREFAWPNALRLWLGRLGNSDLEQDEVSLLETNLDDMTPEAMGYLLEKLMKSDALDVYYTPIQMKKNRPATKLSVLAKPSEEARLAKLIITESSTFGIRYSRLNRYIAAREMREIETPSGKAHVKLKIVAGKIIDVVPEYESVVRLAQQTNRTWRDLYEEVRQAAAILLFD